MTGNITFSHIRFHYPLRPDANALEDFSLAIAPSETVALVGSFAAGKTMFQLLLRFYDLAQGQVLLDGTDIRGADPMAVRQHIAIVP